MAPAFMAPASSRASRIRLSAVGVDIDGRGVLRDVDLVVGDPGITAIIGTNGAGKSTLVDVIAGIRAPSSGSVSRSGLACVLVPQRTRIPELLPVTSRDVVTIGAWGRTGLWRRLGRRDRSGVDRALGLVELAACADRPFSALSGGQRQRVLLAQALARDADLLLLDEPTAALDVENTTRIRDILRHEADRGVAVVIVTHDQTLIDGADRIVRLDAGSIVRHRSGAVARAM